MAVKWTGLDKVKKQIDDLGKSVKNMGPHLKKAVPQLEGSVKRNITDGGRPKKFTDKADGTPATLMDTRLLVAGINGTVEGETVVISSPRVQSAILHFGGKTKPHAIPNAFGRGKPVDHPGSVFPPRPYMLVIDKDMNTTIKIITESIEKGAGL